MGPGTGGIPCAVPRRRWDLDPAGAAAASRTARRRGSRGRGGGGRGGGLAAAQLDQPGHPVAVARVGGEQFQHARVVGDPPGQRPADRPGQVVVADRDRVRVARGALPDLGGGPDPDAGQGPQAPVGLGRVQPPACSSRPATSAAVMIVRARTPSTPARCQSQDGMRAHVRGGGTTRIPPGPGPGPGNRRRRAGTARHGGLPARPPSAPGPRAPGPRRRRGPLSPLPDAPGLGRLECRRQQRPQPHRAAAASSSPSR